MLLAEYSGTKHKIEFSVFIRDQYLKGRGMKQGWAGLWPNQASTTLAMTCGVNIAQQGCADKYLIMALWRKNKESWFVVFASLCYVNPPTKAEFKLLNLMSLSGEGGRNAPNSSIPLATSDPNGRNVYHCFAPLLDVGGSVEVMTLKPVSQLRQNWEEFWSHSFQGCGVLGPF